MISQLLLFAACIAAGALLRGLYFLMRLVCRRTNILAVSIIFDVLFGALCFLPLFLLALFYNDGAVSFYMAAGEVLGFLAAKLIF